MNFHEALQWRYATKRMNGEKVPADKTQRILDAICLAPTSMGLQPFDVLVIETPEGKAKLAEACKQPQVGESSAVLVFCHWSAVTDAQVAAYIQNIADTRGVPLESLEGFRQSILGLVKNLGAEGTPVWTSRQAYIALGFGLAAAAVEEVDATPMEGFDPAALDAVFGLAQKGLRSVALLALGYRDAANDTLAGAKKVRRDSGELFTSL